MTRLPALSSAVFFAALVACGGGGTTPKTSATSAAGATATPIGAASASPSPTPSPSPSPTPIPLIATPANIAFGGVNASQQISVVEKGFSGTFTAVSNDTTIVTVSPASVAVSTTGSPASTGVFVATSIGIGTNKSGSTTITISDGTLIISVPVTVSVTSGQITYGAPVVVRFGA